MYCITKIAQDICYVGASDRRAGLFENSYPVPRGMSYNSYLLTDEKTVLFDTVDASVEERFFENLEAALEGRPLDYLVVHHMEPDHSFSVRRLLEHHKETTVLCSSKAKDMLYNYFAIPGERVQVIKDGDTMSVGKHSVRFVAAPMVHWPEVMMSYLAEEGILFSADAFGTFGALDGSIFAEASESFWPEARRYYSNIVGKYGVQVQNVLKKAAALPIRTICPLHGPVWRKDIPLLLEKYGLWSRYLPEKRKVAVFYGTVYGHMKNAAEVLAAALAEEGIETVLYDVSHTHVSYLVSEAFACSHLVFCSATQNAGLFPAMETFVRDLAAHNFGGRGYAIVESGSWAPQAGSILSAELSSMRGMRQIGQTVKFISAGGEETRLALLALAHAIASDPA